MTEETLSDVLTVNGITLTMYAGVIVKIDEAIGGFSKLDDLPVNPELQSKLVDAIVAKYDKDGNRDGYLILVIHYRRILRLECNRPRLRSCCMRHGKTFRPQL